MESARFATVYTPSANALAVSAGDSVYINGTLNPEWDPTNWSKLYFVGLMGSDGRLVGQFDRFVYAMGETLDYRPYYRHNGSLLPMFGTWTVNGTAITGRKYDQFGYTQWFRVTRDASQAVAIDPIANDIGLNIVRRTIRLTGVATNPSLPVEAVVSTVPVVYATSYGSLIPLPAVWRNNAWETDVDVMKGTTFWVRAMDASTGKFAIPGCYGINGNASMTEFKNVFQQSPGYYYFEVGIDQNGDFFNPRPNDERGGIIGMR